MDRRITVLLLALILALSTIALSACGGDEEESPDSAAIRKELGIDEDNDFEDPAYYNEDDGAEVVTMPHEEKDFVGTWTATSDRAAYMWGNVNLKIKEDGTWRGNITEEDFHGRWRHTGSFVEIKDSEGLIHWKLFYAADGTLMFDDMDEPGDPLVLKPGPGKK